MTVDYFILFLNSMSTFHLPSPRCPLQGIISPCVHGVLEHSTNFYNTVRQIVAISRMDGRMHFYMIAEAGIIG